MKNTLLAFLLSTVFSGITFSQVKLDYEITDLEIDGDFCIFFIEEDYNGIYLNQTRVENGVSPLRQSEELTEFAKERARYLMREVYSENVGKDFNVWRKRVHEGYTLRENFQSGWMGTLGPRVHDVPTYKAFFLGEEFSEADIYFEDLDLNRVSSLEKNAYRTNLGLNNSPGHFRERTREGFSEFGYVYFIILYRSPNSDQKMGGFAGYYEVFQ